ncbi:hypothetical protein OHAE_1615 [Ochrobactrum soli]|uniref:Uncharacterized protein n=1 Tax=Ochrobactrum soli TaxID=2448455 RepID=A0A2P9HNN5_9HYPH|nr:hypothetical protein OHAE_1615 [[Ochrobactrum] soli]
MLVDETLDAVDKFLGFAVSGMTFGFTRVSHCDYAEEITPEDIEERLTIREERKAEKAWYM